MSIHLNNFICLHFCSICSQAFRRPSSQLILFSCLSPKTMIVFIALIEACLNNDSAQIIALLGKMASLENGPRYVVVKSTQHAQFSVQAPRPYGSLGVKMARNVNNNVLHAKCHQSQNVDVAGCKNIGAMLRHGAYQSPTNVQVIDLTYACWPYCSCTRQQQQQHVAPVRALQHTSRLQLL